MAKVADETDRTALIGWMLHTVTKATCGHRQTGKPFDIVMNASPTNRVLGTTQQELDYADSRQVDQWMRHPVYGDPSFDSFEHWTGNPIHRGVPGWEWPVNGFFFPDPVSGHWYVYVGDYREGYALPWRCILYRSPDRGRSWKNLGVILEGDSRIFDQGGGTPDVSVVYADERYHMIYDWLVPPNCWVVPGNHLAEGGIAYAWADRPEGPFHRAEQPLIRNAAVRLMRDRYRRIYATTLIRRAKDWLLLSIIDHPPHSWGLCAMTAAKPEGPYSEPQLVRAVENDYYLPPLMEFFPAFVHEGYVYAPATSVAMNRNFNIICRAPLERATEETTWEIYRHGSTWHADDAENEAYGIWGQTYSGWVDGEGVFRVMFNSRDSKGMGTVNLAQCRWNHLLRERGFGLTGHQGPSLTLLRNAYRVFQLKTIMQVRGTARLLWDYRGALGPNIPQAHSTLHALCNTAYSALEITMEQWKVIRVDADGQAATLASGSVAPSQTWQVMLEHKPGEHTVVSIGGQVIWSEVTGSNPSMDTSCVLGLWTEDHSHLAVDRFRVKGVAAESHVFYLNIEALLGAGESLSDWDVREDPVYRYRCGLVSRREHARVKWNVFGRAFKLWSPRGIGWGSGRILVDGKPMETVDFQSVQPMPSQAAWSSEPLTNGPHAIVLQAIEGVIPVDCLEVIT